jgi:hypothetical protein
MAVIPSFASKTPLVTEIGNGGAPTDAELSAAKNRCGNMDSGPSAGGGSSGDMKPRGVIDSPQERPSGK